IPDDQIDNNQRTTVVIGFVSNHMGEEFNQFGFAWVTIIQKFTRIPNHRSEGTALQFNHLDFITANIH
ncbi:27030_t:CDS:1, partial [Racocetra persica]